MSIRNNSYPGTPWRLRGPIPMMAAPAGEGAGAGGDGGAAAKPDANQGLAKKIADDAATAKKAQEDAAERAAQAAVDAALKRQEADKQAAAAAEKAATEAAAKKAAESPDERIKRFDELEKTLDAKAKIIDTKAQALDTKLERQRERAVIATLRRMGADPARVTDDDLKMLAPKVDPDEPDGLAELAQWATSRPGFFKPKSVGPQESLSRYKEKLDTNKNLTERQRARRQRMADRLLGGGE